jgi:predicted flap endonuclease-1-like 5' DNA nuclease
VFVSLLFILIMVPVFSSVTADFTKLDKKALAAAASIDKLPISEVPENSAIREKLKVGQLPDVNLIGQKLFTNYNFPLQVVGVLLLVATIGCVTLSKKLHGDDPDEETDHRMAKTLAKSSAIPQVGKTSAPASGNLEPKEAVVAEVKSPEAEVVSSPKNAKSDEKLGVVYDSQPDDADDLTALKGVGPVIANKLNGFGIFTFKQIADWTEENKSEFDVLLSFKGRIDRDGWISQASELHANKSI